MLNPIKTKLAILVVGVACLGLGVLFASTLDWTPSSMAVQEQTVPTTQASLRATSNAFTQIARDVTPSVVSVQTNRRVSVRGPSPEFDFGPFEEFFQFRVPPGQEGEGPRFDRQEGRGSGVILREDGYIMTNDHVVAEAEQIDVVLNDGRSFDAEVVGRDPSTDLAVLKIEAEGLPAARLAQSDEVQVGEWVLALGNPFGLDFTMTAGIVSAIGRGSLGIISRGDNPYAIENFIQTDAAINPGNSGGPLVNIEGEVIGINTAIASRTGGYQGYGFAIPVAIARQVATQLIETGRVERAVLGVSIQAVTPLDREALNLPSMEGVLIADFDTRVEDNPARQAGLRPKDVVLAVDGEPVRTPSELQQSIAFHKPGDTVELTIWRGGETEEIDVKLGARPGPATDRELAASSPGETASELGMEVQDMPPQVRAEIAERLDVEVGRIPDGVLVRSVDPFGPAGEANIPPRTIVTQVGDRPVRSVEEYQAAVQALDRGSVVYLRLYFPGVDGQQLRAVRVPR